MLRRTLSTSSFKFFHLPLYPSGQAKPHQIDKFPNREFINPPSKGGGARKGRWKIRELLSQRFFFLLTVRKKFLRSYPPTYIYPTNISILLYLWVYMWGDREAGEAGVGSTVKYVIFNSNLGLYMYIYIYINLVAERPCRNAVLLNILYIIYLKHGSKNS